MTYQNRYFDVNLLDNALDHPNIPLEIPLPETDTNYLQLPHNEPPPKKFSILLNFVGFFTGYNHSEVYSRNEYYYSINKFNPKFKSHLESFIESKLENDEYLDKLIYELLDKELNLNLIQSKDLPQRFKAVKEFMIKYYQLQNDKNFPTFSLNTNFMKICYITVMKLLKSMFPDGIWCNNLEVSNLYQQYLKDPMSIIYMPCHKSHVDYIIMHILAIRFQLSIPTVIAGENLNVAIFGTILKSLGAIFIKRSFNNELYTEKNLQNLLEYIVLNNINIEVFIEGTRSRDGKLLLPKYGILKMLQQIHESTKKDMILQPLSISYERIYETDGYLKELIGKDKKQESFMGIIKNGVTNLVGKETTFDVNKIIDKKLPYNNMDVKLSGKIFVKFGQNFKISECKGNLKQMGFRVLHEINTINSLPVVSIVGSILQVIIYLDPTKKQIAMSDVIQFWPIMIELINKEVSNDNTSNRDLFSYLKSLNMDQISYLVKYQIIKFFKFIRVNTTTDEITIKNPIELLYYKNLILHLLINKSIVCFSLIKSDYKDLEELKKVTHSIKTLLKNEFLFDYNTNEKDEFESIIESLISEGVIDKNLKLLQLDYLLLLSSLVYPFIKSYTMCVSTILTVMDAHKSITEEKLVNDQLGAYPDTKGLLKMIQKGNKQDWESTNKQYLLSCLYYLNYLNLIKIFKNKSKTKAFVIIEDKEKLMALSKFLSNLFAINKSLVDIDYVVDIIDRRRSYKL